MTGLEIRNLFLQFFKKNGHALVESARVLPDNDPTLLFTNAGMNQFKNVFQGLEKRDYTRATSSQKCIRAGGKHNDLENVGHTARHHTFFEMLGNFSFGDYFKREAIDFAWKFTTRELGLDPKRIYISVFEKDDEAAEIWIKDQGISKDRIYRFGEKDNFWRMGETGPCGPSSEIFYDLGPEVGGDPKQNVMGGEGDRYMEFWNLVFMQFLEDESGQTPLPNPSIDTGAGLERLTAILQGQTSNYHTDLFLPLLEVAAEKAGTEYIKDLSGLDPKHRGSFEKSNVALRVLADHARACSFILADGVLPSNEGRGYVLRRILRRAIRFGRSLSEKESLLPLVVSKVIENMSGHFGELQSQKDLILSTVRDEEERFLKTLDQGLKIFNENIDKMSSGQKTLDGELVFKLYDTYGFPMDLTRVLASENQVQLDEKDFEKRMEAARNKARASWSGKANDQLEGQLVQASSQIFQKSGETKFLGYTKLKVTGAEVLYSGSSTGANESLKAGQSGFFIFDQTPFYAEGGGQIGDEGLIQGLSGAARVMGCLKKNGVFCHLIEMIEGQISNGEKVQLEVTQKSRDQTASNHSVTHLLHAALREVLGDQVSQAGSSVEPDRLRFDFTHKKPVQPNELRQIQARVNEIISEGYEVVTEEMSPEQAQKNGALALFGEKYGDSVRVVQMGEFSIELCGGTHVQNTRDIRYFFITSEGGVSSGVRRIEAISGPLALDYLAKNATEYLQFREEVGLKESWVQSLERSQPDVIHWLEGQRQNLKGLQKELQSAKAEQVSADELLKSAQDFSFQGEKGQVIFADVGIDDRKVLSELSDQLRDKAGSSVVVILGQGEKTHPLIVNVSKNFSKSLNAGHILRDLAQTMGGKGGGRPDFAQGAVPDRSKADQARQALNKILNP